MRALDPGLYHWTLTGALSQGQRSTRPEWDLLLFVLRQVTWPQLHCVVLDGIELPILLPLWSGCWDYKPAAGLCDAGNWPGYCARGIHSTNELHPHVVPSLRMGHGQRPVLPSPSFLGGLGWAVNGIQGLSCACTATVLPDIYIFFFHFEVSSCYVFPADLKLRITVLQPPSNCIWAQATMLGMTVALGTLHLDAFLQNFS